MGHDDNKNMQPVKQQPTLKECVEKAMDTFFADLDGQPASNLYEMVMAEVEAPLLDVVMRHSRDNQSKASEILGINRGTLRKKLKQYDLL
ncbi:MAG: DNA-binding transcriptional regulator Fis [Pseudomonadales bacterium]|jgi:Fis family transcriptional regulator